VAWQWLLQALVIRKALASERTEPERLFYEGKFQTFRFFYHYELPKIRGLSQRLLESDGLTVSMTEPLFTD
jgi:butyryl-CoA dehydrogenase